MKLKLKRLQDTLYLGFERHGHVYAEALGRPTAAGRAGQNAYRPLLLPDHLLACLPRTLGTAQGETDKASHYLKTHHMEFLNVCLLLLVPRGAINGLELHLWSPSETGHCQMQGYTEHSTGRSFRCHADQCLLWGLLTGD